MYKALIPKPSIITEGFMQLNTKYDNMKEIIKQEIGIFIEKMEKQNKQVYLEMINTMVSGAGIMLMEAYIVRKNILQEQRKVHRLNIPNWEMLLQKVITLMVKKKISGIIVLVIRQKKETMLQV